MYSISVKSLKTDEEIFVSNSSGPYSFTSNFRNAEIFSEKKAMEVIKKLNDMSLYGVVISMKINTKGGYCYNG